MPLFCDSCGHQNRDTAKFCQGCGGKLIPLTAGGTLQSGVMLDKRYEIKRLIKSGGMGAVYEASDHRFKKTSCAVKEMLSFSMDAGEQQYYISRFEEEALILHNLRHSNLPGVKDYFIEGGRYYLVMDYIEGRDLESIMQDYPERKVPENLVIKWSTQILEALEYLHGLTPPIIYRDLKPGNIMLQASDEKIMLVDFGIARRIDPGSSTTKTSIGTPLFAPAELMAGRPEARSDIYSLGATMHCLLTGRIPERPFDFPPLRNINPSVSQGLSEIVTKSLQMSVDDRFPGATEMRKAIGNLNSSLNIRAEASPEGTVKGFTEPPPVLKDIADVTPVPLSVPPLSVTTGERPSVLNEADAGIPSGKKPFSEIPLKEPERVSPVLKEADVKIPSETEKSEIPSFETPLKEPEKVSPETERTESYEKTLYPSHPPTVASGELKPFIPVSPEPVSDDEKTIAVTPPLPSGDIQKSSEPAIPPEVSTTAELQETVPVPPGITEKRKDKEKRKSMAFLIPAVIIILALFLLTGGILGKSYLNNPERCKKIAENACNQGDFKTAIANYEKVLKNTPDDLDVLMKLGDIYKDKLDSPDEAIVRYEKANKSHPESEEAGKALVSLYMDKAKASENPEDAIKYYEKVISADSENEAAKKSLFDIYLKKAKEDKSIEYYVKALEFEPGNIEAGKGLFSLYREKGEFDSAKKLLEDSSSFGEKDGKSYFSLGKDFFTAKDYEKAIACFRKVLEVKSGSVDSYHYISKSLKSLGKYEDVIKENKKLIEINGKDVEVYMDTGEAYYKLDKYDNAVKCLEKALSLNPPGDRKESLIDMSYNCYMKLGDSLMSEKKYKEASENFQKAFKKKPDSKEAKEKLVSAFMSEGKKLYEATDYYAARDYFTKVVELEPGKDKEKEANDYIDKINAAIYVPPPEPEPPPQPDYPPEPYYPPPDPGVNPDVITY